MASATMEAATARTTSAAKHDEDDDDDGAELQHDEAVRATAVANGDAAANDFEMYDPLEIERNPNSIADATAATIVSHGIKPTTNALPALPPRRLRQAPCALELVAYRLDRLGAPIPRLAFASAVGQRLAAPVSPRCYHAARSGATGGNRRRAARVARPWLLGAPVVAS